MVLPYIGEIRMFGGPFAPQGWALCNGALLTISDNDELFSLLGTTYGGDGRTTFGLPDLRSRIPIHYGNGPGLTSRALGAKGGAENVTLSSNQLASHSHEVLASTERADDTQPSGKVHATSTVEVYSSSGSASMNSQAVTTTGKGSSSISNWQPYLCINFIIALTGIYPSRT